MWVKNHNVGRNVGKRNTWKVTLLKVESLCVCFCRPSEMIKRLLMNYNKQEPPMLGRNTILFKVCRDECRQLAIVFVHRFIPFSSRSASNTEFIPSFVCSRHTREFFSTATIQSHSWSHSRLTQDFMACSYTQRAQF